MSSQAFVPAAGVEPAVKRLNLIVTGGIEGKHYQNDALRKRMAFILNGNKQDTAIIDSGFFLGNDPEALVMNNALDVFAGHITGYDALAVDDHTLSLGMKWLRDATENSEFRPVITNIDSPSGKWTPVKSRIISKGLFSLGIMSVLNDFVMDESDQITLIDPIEAVKVESERLKRNGADALLVLVPEGYQLANRIFLECKNVNLILTFAGQKREEMGRYLIPLKKESSGIYRFTLLSGPSGFFRIINEKAVAVNIDDENDSAVNELEAIDMAMDLWEQKIKEKMSENEGVLIRPFSRETMLKNLSDRFGLSLILEKSSLPREKLSGRIRKEEVARLWGNLPSLFIVRVEPDVYRSMIMRSNAVIFETRAGYMPVKIGVIGNIESNMKVIEKKDLFLEALDWIERNALILPHRRVLKR